MRAIGVLAGLVFAACGIYTFYRGHRLDRVGTRTTAEIVDIVERQSSGPEGGDSSYFPVVVFRDSDGQEVRAEAEFAYSRKKVGDQVPIVYDPRNPRSVVINKFGGRGNLGATLLLILGIFLLIKTFS